MILYKEALRLTLDAAEIIETEHVEYTKSLGRILAEDIFSDTDMPPFNKTAVDGYACKRVDIYSELKVIELIPAGTSPTKIINSGECSKIMTGAEIPDGADCVIMVEDVEELFGDRIKLVTKDTSTNICYRAEDVKKGSVILKKSTLIRPQDIAMFASVGHIKVLVYRLPKVSVISTGEELMEPEQKLEKSKIRNSNAYQLLAQAEQLGCKTSYLGIAADTEESLDAIIKKAFADNDVVLLTGGVSMGDFDLVPKMLKVNGVEVYFKSIAVQPGRPTLFGKRNKSYVFGLPGNPVSSFIQFELLVKPLLYKLMGHDCKQGKLLLPMASDFERKKTARDKWIPGIITEKGEVQLTDYHGSAHIHALSYSDVVFLVPKGVNVLKKGDLVDVRQI